MTCHLQWRASPQSTEVPEIVRTLGGRPGVVRIAWTPQLK